MYAIIPAAGHSLRMGQPKLLMPWQDATVIEHVLKIWNASHISRIVVVVRADDAELVSICRQSGVDLVVPPIDPPDMKQSVAYGLEHIADRYRPGQDASWMLAPADMPTIDVGVINRLIDAQTTYRQKILVPTFGGRPGHPVLLPWSLAVEVNRLGADEGVNSLIARFPGQHIAMPDFARPEDLDLPADYERLRPRAD